MANDPIVNQNTNPVNPPLNINTWADQYQQGTLESQKYFEATPQLRTTGSSKTFAELTSEEQYNEAMEKLETEAIKEDYDNFLTGAGKIAGQVIFNVAAMIGDFLGTITDPGDIRIIDFPQANNTEDGLSRYFDPDYIEPSNPKNPVAEALKGGLNNIFKFIDNNIWGDGEDETGNTFTRSAKKLRDLSQHYFQVNTSSDWFDTSVNFVVPIVASVLGAARTGNITAAMGEIAGLSKAANMTVNAFIMTESTGLSIAQDVHDKVYGEVLNTLSKGQLVNLEETARQQAIQSVIDAGGNIKDAEWAGMEAVKKAREDFALANPELGKQAAKNAGYGADIALKSMTPAFILNLVTANMYTRSLYAPSNILSKPKWINAKDFFKETGTEIVEEAGIENIAEKKGIAYGTKGSYTLQDLKDTIFSYDTLYSGLGAIIGGGGSTVFSSIPIVGDFNERKKQYEEQQEVIIKQNRVGSAAGFKDMIDKATTLTMDLGQVTKLGKEAAILEQMGMKEEASILKDKMLAIQAHEAFSSGTTSNLIENYKKIASNPNAGPEIQLRAREAIAEIEQMGKIYEKTKGKYINDQEVYGNKINEQNLNKVERQLQAELIQKKLEADAAIKLELELGNISLDRDVPVMDESGKVVETKKEQLGYDVANLKVNPFTDAKEAETYKNFSDHVSNNVQAVRELNELQQRLDNIKELKKDNFERYNKITSKEYQKSLRFEQRLGRIFEKRKNKKQLEELKGTDQYMPFVDALMEKYKGYITNNNFQQIRNYFENQNNLKKEAEEKTKEEIKNREFAKSESTEETDTEEVTSTGEATGEAQAARPEGTKAMLENVARKLSSGESVKSLSKEEQEFYMNNNDLVDKRATELKSGSGGQTQEEVTEDEELSQELQDVSNEVSSELDDILGSKEKETEVKPISNSKVEKVLGTTKTTSNEEQIVDAEKRLKKANEEYDLINYFRPNAPKRSLEEQMEIIESIEKEISGLKAKQESKPTSDLDKQIQALEEERKEQIDNIGAKQKERAFSQLRDEKDEDGKVTKVRTPEEKLNAINLIERNVLEGATLTNQEQKEVEKIKDELASQGYEVSTLLGKKFDSGMKVIVTTSPPDDTLAEGEEVITKIIKPQILKDGVMIQTAQIEVTVGTKKGGLSREQWLEEQKKKESRADKINDKYNAKIAELKAQQEGKTEGKSNEQQKADIDKRRKDIISRKSTPEEKFEFLENIPEGTIFINEDGDALIVRKKISKRGTESYELIPLFLNEDGTWEENPGGIAITEKKANGEVNVNATLPSIFTTNVKTILPSDANYNSQLAALEGTTESKPTLSTKEKEILSKFKDGKKAKALLNRQFPDSKADIQSLLDKGVIKEQGNDYIIAALEPQQVTVTVAKTKAEQVADNLLAQEFTKDAEGNFTLQIDLRKLPVEQARELNQAIATISDKIENKELDGWNVFRQEGGDLVTITKPSLTSAQPQEQEGESNQPDEVPELTKQQEQRIKELVEDYTTMMEMDNNKFPTFEEFIKSYIRTAGKAAAEKHLKLLGKGWELNGHGTINDYNAILRKLFGSFEDVAKNISMLSDELSQSVATPEEVSVKQEELVKEEQIKDNAVPIDVTPDKEVVYSTSTDIVDNESPKLGYSVFDFSTSQKIQTKDGRTVVKIETINEGLKKNQGKGRIKPIKTANFNKVKPGTKLTVITGEGGALDFKFLRTLVIPQRVEDKNDPLYGTDVLKNGKTQTITFGEWVDGKLKEKGMTLEDLPEFIKTQEFWDVVPIFVADSDGDYIGQIHDPGWYTKAKFGGDIDKARRNVNEVRKLIKEAYFKGENVVFEINNVTGGKYDSLVINEFIPLSKANPQALIGLIVKDKEGNFKTFIYENGKRVEVIVENLPMITSKKDNQSKSIMKVDIRRWGTDENGKPTYKAFYSTSPKLSKAQVDTVSNIIYSKLIVDNNELLISQNNKFGKLLNEIKSTLGSDISDNASFIDVLKRYIYISPIKDLSQSFRNELIAKVTQGNIAEVEATLAKKLPNLNVIKSVGDSAILSLAPDILVVAKNTINGIQVKIINKNTIPVENNEIVKNEDFNQRDALLKEVLGNSLLNGYTGVANYNKPVIQVNNDFTVTTVANNYSEFVQGNVLSNVMSVNVGTAEQPVYATRLQANIYYTPVGTEKKDISRKEGQSTVGDSKVTEQDKQVITNVIESTSDEAFVGAVEAVEQDGFELFGNTVEEKAEDLKEVVKQMNNESKEIVENHLEAEPNLDDITEYNEFLNQASNKVKWVNEYFNEDNNESAESLESNQPREIGDEDVKEMNINLMRIDGLSGRHQTQLAVHAAVKLGEILTPEKINEQEVRDNIVEEIGKVLNPNKQELEETLEKLKSIPQYEDRPKVVALIKKYEVALDKINLVLDNVDVVYEQAKAMAIKDLNGKITEDNKVEIGNDPTENNLDNEEDEGDVDDELTAEEDAQIGTENYSKTSLEVNPKASITTALRKFMRGIPDISSATGLPKTGAMGVTTYVDFDTVYDVVQSILADAPVDFNMMMDILKVNQDKQPWIPVLIDKLKQSSPEIRNQFTTTMGKHALTMEFLMYSFDKNGNVRFQIYNTNSSSINRKIKDEWNNNLKSANNLINEYGDVSRERVSELLNEYNSWMTTPRVLSSEHQRTVKEKLKIGETSFSVDESNKSKQLAAELNKQDSKTKIVSVDNKEYLVSLNFNDTISITPYERNPVSKALVDYTNLTPEESKQATEKIKDWFEEFGIELTDNAIAALFGDTRTPASQFFDANNNFAVGTLVKWLKTSQSQFSMDKEVTVTDENKNNPLDNTSIGDLAYHQSKYSTGIVTSSFRDGKKSIYGFTAFKFITDRANEIKKEVKDKDNKTKSEFRDNLRKLSFSKNSFWLKLFEDGVDLPVFKFRERFSITHLGLTAIKQRGKKIYRDNGITALGDVDHELVKVGMHQDTKQGAPSKKFMIFGQEVSLRNITTLFPTMSDKSTMTLIKTLGLKLTDKKYYSKTESGKLVPNESISNFIFEQTVLPEIERVIAYNAKNPDGTDIKGYDKGAKMLLLMPHLNDVVIYEDETGKKITLKVALNTKNADIEKILSKKDVLITEIQNYTSALVEEKMKVWANNGYYTVEEREDGTNKVTTKLLDSDYMKEVIADNELEKIQIAAMDFEINQMISNANAFMTMIGDPALYYKSDSTKSSIEQSKETFTNVGKRLAAMIAPGSKLADSENEQYTQVFINDRVALSENISTLTQLLDNKDFNWKEYNEIQNLEDKDKDPVKAKELKDKKKRRMEEFYDKYPNSNGYFDIEGTDAQEYTTWQEHLHILEKLGRLNDATVSITPDEIREAKEMFANNVPLDKMSEKQKGILQKVLQPIKPVYTGQIFDEKQDVMRMVYIKSSSFPLIPQVTEGTELNKLREALEGLQKEGAGPNPSPYKYVRASYQSANKVGAKANPIDIYNGDGSIKDLKIENLKASSLTLNRKDFKIQLDVPYKSFKKKQDTVSLGTQLNKILFGNGIMDATGFMLDGEEVSGKKLEEEYTKAFIELSNLKRAELYEELGIDIKTNKPIDVKKTAVKLQEILKREAVNRGYSKQDVEALEIVVKEQDIAFKLPLWLSSNSNRFESLLNAIVNNRIVKMKFPGSSFVAGSEEGFKFQHDFKGVDKNKIVWTNKWNNQSLQAAKYDANGNLLYAQVIAPSKFRKQDGTLIDLLEQRNGQYVYVTKTKTGFRLKEDMIDPELRNITAFRIPTSGHMSAAQVEIVGFLPNEQGDLMIVPRNLTKQKGLDFDVDKENTYSLWHETDKDGRITVLKEGDNKEKLLQNKIIKIHSAVLSNPDKEVQKKINGILSIDYAKKQAEQIDNMISSSKGDDTYFTPLSSEYQKNKMFLGASGKIGIGAYSLDVTTHSLFEQAKAKGNQISLNHTYIDEKGKTVASPFRMSFEGEGSTDGELGDSKTIDGERTIAQVLSELQNIATDNEKEQVMGRVNLNSYTLDVSKILAMLGFDKAKNGNSIQFTFLSQPILREYVKEMDNVNSNVSEFSFNKEQAVIEKLLEKYGNENYELGYEADTDNAKNFTMDKMESQLRGEPDNNFQLAVLNRFLELKKLGVAVRTLQGAINTDSKGLGKSILDNSQKIESINNLINNPLINNASTLLGDFIPIERIEDKKKIRLTDEEQQSYLNDGYLKFGNNLFKPTTINGVFTANALVTATSLWDKHFPYNSEVFNSIFDELMPLISKSEASDAKKVEKKTMVIKEIKKFLNSYAASETLFDNVNAQAERERLFYDRVSTGKVSLVSYIKELKKSNSSLASNKLIERLELIADIQGGPSSINFNNTSAGFYDEDGINNGLLELMELNLNLPSFNGEPYTSRKLAQDLITFAYLEGGVQEATQFVKFVPLAYLSKMGFSLRLSSIDFDSIGAYSVFGMSPGGDADSKFITQFAQHNPSIMPKLDNIIPGIKNFMEEFETNLDKFDIGDIFKDIAYQGMFPEEYYEEQGFTEEEIKKFENTLSNKIMNAPISDFVALRKDGEYFLWKKQGNTYVKVPVVNSGMSEYDSSVKQITPLSAEPMVTENPIQEQPLSTPSDESKVTNELRFGLNSGKSLTDIVTEISNSTAIQDKYLVDLAKQLLSAIDPSTSITVGDIKTRGKYKRAENAIIISASQAKNATDTELARTILKELMHSITDNELSKHVYRDDEGVYQFKTNNAPAHIQVLIRLFNQVAKIPEFETALVAIREKLKIKGQEQALTKEENRIYYGAYDVYEFVEMMMTQPEFQQEMAKIKTNSGKSVLDLFKDFLGKLFNQLGINFESGTIASEAIENILILVDEKGRLKKEPVVQPTTTQQTGRKTYSGKVTSLKPNQIFVFGSNIGSSKGGSPTHGAGSAKIAKDKFGAIQGQSRGLQGQSYGIVTKKYYDVEKSSTPQEITQEIKSLYEFAKQNPNKEFLVSDYSESNLNGYTGQQMADMFNAAGPIPSNIVFNENFDKLITQQTQPVSTQTQPTVTPTSTNFKTEDLKFKSSKLEEFTLIDGSVVKGYAIEIKGQPNTDLFVYKENKVGWTVIDNKTKLKFPLNDYFSGSASTKKEVLESMAANLNMYVGQEKSKKVLESIGFNFGTTQPTTTQEVKSALPVSNPVKNDLIKILEDINEDINEESDNLDFPDVSASEFSGYPNIQKYLNSEYGIEKREYDFFKKNKDVVEDLLAGLKGVTANNFLELLKSSTDTKDTGVDSNIKPIITADTKKEQALVAQANAALKGTKYELFPDVFANEGQTEALDKLEDFVKAPRDKSEKTQSTFVLVGRGGTGKTTIVKKITDMFPGKKVVGAAVSHTAKNNLKKSLGGKTVKTISAVTGLESKDKIREGFNDTTLSKADVIIIDECSMIDTVTMNRIYELASPNVKIIFMGDNVQLRPINENSSPTFDAATKAEYNAKLTERMRQGKESPIVPLSDIVAENVERPEKEIERKVIKRRENNFNPITNKGVIFTNSKTELMENLKRDLKSDIQNTKIISYSNDTNNNNRDEMNGVVRDILWGADAKNEYNVGEILVSDNNFYEGKELTITNGEYYQVQNIKPIPNAVTVNNQIFPGYALTVKVISETDNFGKTMTITLPNAASKEQIKNKSLFPDINYGYAITSHKAQGSTYNNVYVMEDNIISSRVSNKEVNESLYVAMTRPRNKLVMFSELKEGEFLTEEQKSRSEPTGESLQPQEVSEKTTETKKDVVSSAVENQIEELIRKGIIKSKCD